MSEHGLSASISCQVDENRSPDLFQQVAWQFPRIYHKTIMLFQRRGRMLAGSANRLTHQSVFAVAMRSGARDNGLEN